MGGVRKLAEFDRSRIVVAVAGAQIVIRGDGLKIARFDENEICVEGKIAGVETAQKTPLLEKGSVDDTALRTDKTTLASRKR